MPVHPFVVLPHLAHLVEHVKLGFEISLLFLLGEAADRVECCFHGLSPTGFQGLVGGVLRGERAAEGGDGKGFD